ncbi:MAG TPA: hypothetical protein VGG72_13465 [Bryobacteraceae bacterium]
MSQNTDLKSLDGLISRLGGDDIGGQSSGPCRLLMEHIQAARRGLLGSMRAEYCSSLQFAKDSVECIPGKDARAETTRILQGLIDSEGPGRLLIKQPQSGPA